MNAALLIKQARSHGATVYLKGDQAAVRGQLPDTLVAAMRAAKPEIIAELKAEATFDPQQLQRVADQRNAQAKQSNITDRFCQCGRLATLAWPDRERRELWKCDDCAPTANMVP